MKTDAPIKLFRVKHNRRDQLELRAVDPSIQVELDSFHIPRHNDAIICQTKKKGNNL